MSDSIETQALVERSLRGDAEAFGEVYRRTWSMTYAFVTRQVADRDEAASLAQEAYARAFESLPTLRDPAAFPGFLRTIAARVVQDFLRSPRKARESVRESVPEAPDASEPDPARRAELSEAERALLAALDEFEPLHREALLLRLVEGRKHREVADRLGITIDQASGILARGLSKLAERLERFFPGGAP